MRTYLESLVRDLGNELEKIDKENISSLARTQFKLKRAQEALKRLSNEVTTKTFKTIEDEITYYKHLKPQIYSKVIFFEHVIRIETSLPIGSNKNRKTFLKKEQLALERFFCLNRSRFQYLRAGHTHLDQEYFTAGSRNADWVSGLLAAELLHQYLQEKIRSLKKQPLQSFPGVQQLSSASATLSGRLKWSATKADLVELIYALHAAGSFNDGKASIKSIAACFEELFGVPLSDYRYAFKAIKNRHRSDKFLTRLQRSVQARVEEGFD